MRAATHLSFAFLIFLSWNHNDVLSLLACLLGSVFPDIDSSQSMLGRFLRPVGWVSRHRGFFHSVFSGIFFASIFLVYDLSLGAWFFAGYMSHLILDSLNHAGIAFLNPLSRWRIRGSIKSGGILDRMMMIVFLVAALAVSDLF